MIFFPVLLLVPLLLWADNNLGTNNNDHFLLEKYQSHDSTKGLYYYPPQPFTPDQSKSNAYQGRWRPLTDEPPSKINAAVPEAPAVAVAASRVPEVPPALEASAAPPGFLRPSASYNTPASSYVSSLPPGSIVIADTTYVPVSLSSDDLNQYKSYSSSPRASESAVVYVPFAVFRIMASNHINSLDMAALLNPSRSAAYATHQDTAMRKSNPVTGDAGSKAEYSSSYYNPDRHAPFKFNAAIPRGVPADISQMSPFFSDMNPPAHFSFPNTQFSELDKLFQTLSPEYGVPGLFDNER